MALIALGVGEARTAAAVFERMFPGGEDGPGATEIGVVDYLDRALAGEYAGDAETYRVGLATLDHVAREAHGAAFADCAPEAQDALLERLEADDLPGFKAPSARAFFDLMRAHLQEGLFADPAYGGNRDKRGWRLLGHPGIWFENGPEEHLATEPVTKGGEIRALADVGRALGGALREPEDIPGYDPQRGAEAPAGPADVVLVGVGAAGAQAAAILTAAGLRVVGLEAGPWRTKHDFVPDELGSAYYCRGGMGPKFMSEVPRWRVREGEEAGPATFTLGRMMNGIGGSVIHWGGALRRCHPHHFAYLSYVREAFGEGVLPEGHTLVDWPYGYDELEPHYSEVEHQIGVAGDERNPWVRRSRPLPLPPVRPFTMGERFREAAERMGLHPYPTPVAVNSAPYNGFPQLRYCAWSGGFGPFDDERWHPGLTWVPQALATGNLDLRTHCRVLRVLTGADGRARGVEYVDAGGRVRVQEARAVLLCGYTLENVRLLLLSADDRRPAGLGNASGQVGRHFMTKMWSDLHGYFPDTVFNAHTGPAAQMWGLDDFEAAGFDAPAHGFVGGATPSVENQRLPIQIAREALPDDVRGWGADYKAHLRRWQHVAAVRLQPSSLSYHANFLDLDPRHRDRSGLGLPVMRITYDMQRNEHRLAAFMEDRAAEILREMGATQTWKGPRFGGVLSSHDLGGCRMGEDPRASVVDPDLQVHDTPGLHVFGTAVFPSCHGVNPTLTMWAVCRRAAQRLVERLREE
jgi:gluconate 2-dehydrogenase alpha chain